jgi:Mn2+/Fe2+ NRAMP family transporter
MKNILGLTLGVMTALGGFVDLSQIVFTMQAGALFGYGLMWAILFGTVGIILYMEMCGRVAAVSHQAVFAVVRTTLGDRLGLFTLIASNLLNLLTCTAELGAIGIILHLLTGWPARLVLVLGTLLIGAIVWAFKFEWIERTFGLWGLMMIVFAVVALKLHPDWPAMATHLIPQPPPAANVSNGTTLYAFFAVGIFSALLMEYEVQFYSSGAIEEHWDAAALSQNTFVAVVGTALGSLVTVALLVVGAKVFLPRGIFPDLLSSTALPVLGPFGHVALLIALLGMLATISSAAVETAMCVGYNTCQFYKLKWDKNVPQREVPIFTGLWVGALLLSLVIALTGIEPLKLVDYSIILGMVLMPLTYYPILKAARDPAQLGKHVTGTVQHRVAWVFLIAIVIAAVVAVPLMIVTKMGKP